MAVWSYVWEAPKRGDGTRECVLCGGRETPNHIPFDCQGTDFWRKYKITEETDTTGASCKTSSKAAPHCIYHPQQEVADIKAHSVEGLLPKTVSYVYDRA